MGLLFTLPFQNVSSNATSTNTMTVAGIIAANTAGYRGALRAITVTPDGVPVDDNLDCAIWRTNNAGAGTAGSSPTPVKKDPGSRASIMTAGLTYANGFEPSTFETTAAHYFAVNGRGGYMFAWSFDDAIKWGINQTLCLRILPIGYSAAILVSGVLEYEEW
jgi:hypothetical protein